MTLITAVIGGLIVGWTLGFNKRGAAVMALLWLAVLVLQTAFVVERSNIPPQDWAYIPVQVVIAGIATLMLWVGSKLRGRFATKPTA